MKRLRKSFLSISIITLFLLIFAGITQSYAAIANPAVRYGVVSVRPDAGYGYLVSGNDKVWKIVEYNNASSNPAVIDYSKTIYCLKQGLGFGSGGIRPDPEYYDTYFDMKKDYGTMPANYKSMLPENYNEVLWLLDNIYVADGTESSKQEREALLAKVFKDDLEDDMLYPPFTMEDIVLTDSDMDVVQQLAIWYFTNPENDYLDNNINLYISPDELAQPNEFKILSDREFDDEDGYIRLEQANKYFSYLKREAVANASNYGDGAIREDNRRPIELSKTGIAVNKQGNNYIIGPYKINKITDADYTLNATFKEGSQAGQTFTDYTLLDQNQQPTSKTINELVGENFYISVPVTTDVETIVFTINVEYYVRELQYWTVGDAPSTNQPIVIVKRIPKNYSDSVSVTIPKEEPEKIFDLSLRKFITAVNDEELRDAEGNLIREPQVDVSKLNNTVNGTYITTADYNHIKTPVSVKAGDIVTYTIRVYNEGETAGYANEITDYLPEELEFLPDDALNQQYGWVLDANDPSGRTVTTNYLSKETETTSGDHLLDAFAGDTLDYKDVQIRCKVKTTNVVNQKITNIAEITEYKDESGNPAIDRDSTQDNVNLPPDNELPNYKDDEINSGIPYIPGQEDDDDFEKLVMQRFDLSLRKFITAVNGEELLAEDGTYLRAPIVDVTPLVNGTGTTAIYNHTKIPVGVQVGDEVVYTIRVYNEGEVAGYANEIVDHLPPELEFLPDDELNKQYGWELDANDTTGRTIRTKYLSFETNAQDNLIEAFDKDTMETLDYKEVKVKCKVRTTQETGKKITNIADITEYKDENGNVATDIDSDAGNVVLPTDDNLPNYKDDEINSGADYIPGQEDDDDFEKLVMKKFDLSLRKFITSVNGEELVDENGKYLREPVVDVTPLVEGTGTTAIYNHTKVPVGVKPGDIVVYTIRVYNEGEVAGYANEIVDHLPPELEFIINDDLNASYGWKLDPNDTSLRTIRTSILSYEYDEEENLIDGFDKDTMETLDYKEIKVKCKVKDVQETGKKITNIADITEYKDESGNIATDIDSKPDNVVLPPDSDLPNYKDDEINSGADYIPGQEDDDDFEKLKMQQFDLALRKFITKINDGDVTSRIPVVDASKLYTYVDGKLVTTATYTHPKDPILVSSGDTVVYTIRIYNEGDVAGYASEIMDDIPEGLEFLPENDTNITYRWKMLKEDGTETDNPEEAVKITTDYLSKEQEKNEGDNLIPGFDKSTMTEPAYKDVKVAFKVTEPNSSDRVIINTAEITDDTDEDGNPVEDIDSTPDNEKPEEDDIDIEKIKVVEFDLALRKFITAVNDTEITDRVPQVNIAEDGTISYLHTKEPVEVVNGNLVTYTLRIYNEGTMNGYAKEIKDDIPDGLEFVPDNSVNQEYRWKMLAEDGETEVTDVEDAKYVVTDYLSKEQETVEGGNMIPAFDRETMTEPAYKDVKVVFKVVEPNTSDRVLINTAEITDDSDEDGNDVVDKDSVPDNDNPEEDDIDIEKVKVKYFDLALKKWVTQAIVTQDGKTTVTETGHTGDENPEPIVKVDLHRNDINDVTVKFKYKIKVTNEGEIEGYVKEITDHIPDGLRFEAADNPKWTQVDDKTITTDQLKDTLLQPGESATVEVILTWINDGDNMGVMTNIAEISEDYNDSNTPDIDSTPGNEVPGEDDIDDAPVMLTVAAGEVPSYIGFGTLIVAILAGGIFLIKKYVFA